MLLTSSLLAHCGGGQDNAGLPWPLSEAAPALFFSLTSLSKKVLYFLASRWPPEVLQAPLLFNFQLLTSVARAFSCPFSNFYFPFSKGGRSFPAASLPSSRSRPLNSSVLKRPSRHSQRRKSSARPSPCCDVHSDDADTTLRYPLRPPRTRPTA